MKVYLKQNVFDAALDRIRYIFDEFPTVAVTTSGGKDSTVVLNLALQVAKEKKRLPLKVVFIDQEAEWQCVIDHIREVMQDPRIDPYWFQIPIKLFNATSSDDPWLYCWEEGAQWMRSKEPKSYTINRYNTDRFKNLFTEILRVEFPPQSCFLGGVRCEESPTRTLGLTSQPTYKHITYGKIGNRLLSQFTFYPIYDWTYRDVWKAIHDNQWPYCPLYDTLYQYGVATDQMRVSNLHHETAVHSLFFLQEIEPETWDKLTARLSGIHTAGVWGKQHYFLSQNATLPYMFTTWKDYRDYLLDHLITDQEIQQKFRKKFTGLDRKYEGLKKPERLKRFQINTILANDHYFTKLDTWERRAETRVFRRWKKTGRISNEDLKYAGYIPTT